MINMQSALQSLGLEYSDPKQIQKILRRLILSFLTLTLNLPLPLNMKTRGRQPRRRPLAGRIRLLGESIFSSEPLG